MFLKKNNKNKLHKYAILLVVLTVMILLPVLGIQTTAQRTEFGFSEALWNSPTDDPRITNIENASIEQTVAIDAVLHMGSGEEKKLTIEEDKQTVSEITSEELKNASLELREITSDAVFEDGEVTIGSGLEEWKYDYKHFHKKDVVTYYRALTVSEAEAQKTGILDGFEEAVWEKYPHKKEDGYEDYGAEKDVLMTKHSIPKEAGKAFDAVIEEVAAVRGLQIYVPGTEIPLHKDGEGIARVDMITLQAVDYMFDMSCGTLLDRKTLSRDFDIVLTTIHSYEFPNASIEVDAPDAVFESGRTLEQGIVRNDALIKLKKASDTAIIPEGCRMEYYLSETMMQAAEIEDWIPGDTVSEIGNHRYVYMRTVAPEREPGKTNYSDSEVVEKVINYLSDMPEGIQILVQRDGNADRDGVDVGDKIMLSTESREGMIVYTLDGTEPAFTKVPYEQREELDILVSGTSEALVLYGGFPYVKVNNLWYKCNASTTLYESAEPIVVDENIYMSGDISIQAQALVNGKAIGAANRFRYSLDLKEQTKAPTAVPETDTDVGMGDPITLLCEDQNARIFYTLNGSAPVINILGNRLVLGNGTYEYEGHTPIYVSEDFATYGGNVTVTAQAVSFTEYQGKINRLKKDSPITKFSYSVGSQTPVAAVTSVPATTEESPTEVLVGESIRLITETPDTVIYYTIDGTEPTFDKASGKPSGTTIRYDAMDGVVVPEMTDSSMFRITAVAHKPGLATGNISRLVFKYPPTVGAPYAAPSAGAVAEGTMVTLQTTTEDALIYYEVAYGGEEPAEPTINSSIFGLSNPFEITKETWIKAVAINKGMSSEVVNLRYTVSEKLDTPTPSVASGSVISSGTVITLQADPEATVYYTLDGSNPKDAGNQKVLVGTSIMINGAAGDAVALRTYASKTGCSDSEVGYYSYRISAYEGGIYADRESGSIVKNGEIIHLSTDVTDALIYYTTDGTTPTEYSKVGSAVFINGAPGENVVVKAIAIAKGTDRTISSGTFTYTIMDKLAAPVASVPNGAIFTSEGVVELSAESGKIYYTLNGDEPTSASTLYRKGITISQAVTIRAVAIDDDYQPSEISTYTYGFADQVKTPVADHESGELQMGTLVTFSCDTEGAVIYYRTDGAEPSPKDRSGTEIYTGPIAIEKATTFKIIAVKEQMQNSKVVTVGYTVKEAIVEEVVEEEETVTGISQTDRLQSRRSFSGENTGPSFSDVVLKNASYGAIVSAEEGTLPDQVELRVERAKISETAEQMIKQTLNENYGVVASYNVTLLANDEEVQPNGEIEIGLPIPSEYENALIQIVHVQDDGTVETFPTRRSNGVAYAKTDHLSIYSIAATVTYTPQEEPFPWLLVTYSLAVLLGGVGIGCIYKYNKMRREQDE